MSMKKWTDEELISTRDKLEALGARQKKSSNTMWHLTAFLGAFAVSTGIAFIFFDGVDLLNVLLIVMGSITCLAWYKSEKQRKDNQNFLFEINSELKRREKNSAKNKAKSNSDKDKDNKNETVAAAPAESGSSNEESQQK
ncbi:MAG: hypothetical protein R3E36_10020 [Nitrosomonas sp.]|nr:hypothetical protein [Nitrosomonas sp.]MCP5250980.1 hypothetical protein [Burkholderiales bacterium]MDR4520915.1 hypothetical protein [Nitrosomonas sp.]